MAVYRPLFSSAAHQQMAASGNCGQYGVAVQSKFLDQVRTVFVDGDFGRRFRQ